MGHDSEGVLLIRAWIEQGSTEPLHAHIESTVGLPPAPVSDHAVAGVNPVLEAVKAWLQQILATSKV